MMKRLLLGAIALAALGVGAPAMAADLPPAPTPYVKAPVMMPAIYDWSGVYVGVNGGWGTSHRCWDQTGPTLIGPDGCHNTSGGFAGGQAGYRWQTGPWVWGFEAQGDWADFKGSSTSLLNAPSIDRSRTDAFGLFTGQVGYAWNNVLWYVKGGAAMTHDKYTGSFTATGVSFDQASETRWGGAVGTGVEVAFAPGWSVGVEYDHLFMGSSSLNFASIATGAFTRTDSIKQDVDMGTVRIDYTFGGPVVAKY